MSTYDIIITILFIGMVYLYIRQHKNWVATIEAQITSKIAEVEAKGRAEIAEFKLAFHLNPPAQVAVPAPQVAPGPAAT